MLVHTSVEEGAARPRFFQAPQRQESFKVIGLRALGRLSAGLNAVLGSRARQTVGIVTYHRIAPPVAALPKPTHNVTPERFRAQLAGLLARGFRFWSLSRILACNQRQEPVPPRTLAVTFDDGFQTVYTHAWPVLQELRVPATVFLSTAYLDSCDPFPFDDWGLRFQHDLPPETYRPLTTAQCREMTHDGLLELGSHTHSHEDFRGRPAALLRDLQRSLEILQERFALDGRPMFAFPFGKPHLGFTGEDCVAAVKAAGFRCALNTGSYLVEPQDDPFHWGRFNAFCWDTDATLAGKLSGWYSWAPVLRARIAAAFGHGRNTGT
jgi:peptidoglycan/xylan/chitin deacetylase (PgdA/CDA1 family)